MPTAAKLMTRLEPPALTNGSGIPVTGAIPIVMPTLTTIWKSRPIAIPPATIAEKRSRATAIVFRALQMTSR